MTRPTLLRGGWVLSLDPRVGNFAEADVLVEDGRIAEVGVGLRRRDAEVIDAADCIVMPGFVDTHRHVWRSLFRNLGEEGSGGDGHVSGAAYGPHYGPDDVYAATLIGLLGALEAGVTTVVDWSDIQVEPAHTEAALSAHADAGIRTVFVHAAPRWAGAENPGLPSTGLTTGPATTLAFGPPTPDRSRLDGSAWNEARQRNLRIHVHTGADPADRGLPTAMAAAGMLGGDVTLVHCTNLDDTDLDAIAASGAAVSLTPASEMAGGAGAPPLQKLIDRGIRPGLGVDTERGAPGAIFAQMRAVISLQHATYFDLKLAGKAGLPNLLTTREVIRYATADGARVAGVGEVTGTLTPGRAADIVVLRADRPNIWPVNDPIGAVVWGMDTSNVDTVLVAGNILTRHGSIEAGVDRPRELAVAARTRVAAAAGLTTVAGGGT